MTLLFEEDGSLMLSLPCGKSNCDGFGLCRMPI